MSSPEDRCVELVRAKEAEGWTFVFLGAGLDAYARGRRNGLPRPFGPALRARRRRRRHRVPQPLGQDHGSCAAGCGEARAINIGDFFEDDKPAEADRERRQST